VRNTAALRNALIIIAIAVVVFALPAGGRLAATVQAALGVALGAAVALIGVRIWNESRGSIELLGDAHRALLYGSLALGVFLFVGRPTMWATSSGELAWFLLALGVVYGLLESWRRYRSY
jgi:hypothetical protein